LVCGILLADRWGELGNRLFDADDAMRLVQVREFLAGRGWFDLYEPRLDPPTGYVTHWSRLIDAGLAGLFLLARTFADADLAERLMRAIWPLLWLFAVMAGVAAMAWRIAGRPAAILALVIAACAMPALQHFKVGRIDHHNVQIALAMAVLASAAWSDRARHAAALAGGLTGLAFTIGLESFLFIALAGVAVTWRFIADGRGPVGVATRPEDKAGNLPSGAQQLARYGIAVTASIGVGFLLSVKPDHWGHAACDAIAINWLVPAATIGIGFLIAGHKLAGAGLRARVGAIAMIGAAAFVAFAMIEPRCLGGPFALTDSVVKAIWLDHVDETAPLLAAIRGFPLMGVWLCSFPLAAILATCVLARDGAIRHDFGFCCAVAALVVAVATSFAAVKIYSYAMWFGMPLVAAAASRVTVETGLRAAAARLATALMLTPMVITAVGIIITQAAAGPDPDKPGMPERNACSRNVAYGTLAQLPLGRAAVEINYGPYVLALTRHSVLAAPYHRVHGGIVAANTLLNGSPHDAHHIADQFRLDYIAVCGKRASTGDVPPPGSLWVQLNVGNAPEWLEQLSGGGENLFAVYRVRR
jgi:hypothetical protein